MQENLSGNDRRAVMAGRLVDPINVALRGRPFGMRKEAGTSTHRKTRACRSTRK